ncbi:hypothetical protein GCM10027445_50320 [Amycolatopsis endophytica]
MRGTHFRERVGARHVDRIRFRTLREQPIALGTPDPHLFGQVVNGHRAIRGGGIRHADRVRTRAVTRPTGLPVPTCGCPG